MKAQATSSAFLNPTFTSWGWNLAAWRATAATCGRIDPSHEPSNQPRLQSLRKDQILSVDRVHSH
eukprot:8542357-Pyramimonas_sp.AAC.1